MYSVTVRDHIMIAHSLRGAVFGPAQRLHGATYVVDVEFRRPDLDEYGIVVDIGLATDVVHRVLAELNFKNLDWEASFKGRNSTTEVIARTIFDRIVAAIGGDQLGTGGRAIESIRVTLGESHVAAAAFDGRVKLA